MTFTTSLKEEITKNDINSMEARYELMAFLNSVAKFNKEEISITLENASIARRIYKEIKEIYDVNPSIVIRMQKRFKVKQIYILNIKERIDFIKKDISVGIKIEVDDLVSDEEKIAFLEGAFLAVGGLLHQLHVSAGASRGNCLSFQARFQQDHGKRVAGSHGAGIFLSEPRLGMHDDLCLLFQR